LVEAPLSGLITANAISGNEEGILMAAEKIGWVKSGKGSSYEVKWSPITHEIYVSYAGWSYVGKASSPRQAMQKAEAWLYNK